MTGPKSGSSWTGSGMAIPSSDKKLVQNLKEILPNNEDEIYAMLKECNMDPDETVQRLLNEDTFHIVKRKRDKKKEVTSSRDSSDRSRSASTGLPSRAVKSTVSVDRSSRRLISSSPNTYDSNQHRTSAIRDNGVYTSTKNQNAASSSVQGAQQIKGASSATSGEYLPSTSFVNGDYSSSRSISSHQGAWAGLLTVADVVKSYGIRSAPPIPSSMHASGHNSSSNSHQHMLLPADPDEQPTATHEPSLHASQNHTLELSPNAFPSNQIHDHSAAHTDTMINSDWKSIIPAQDKTCTESSAIGYSGLKSAVPFSPVSDAEVAVNLEQLNLEDEESVVVPNHLRVCDTDCGKLKFGSFGEDSYTAFQIPRMESVEKVEQQRDVAMAEQTSASGTRSHASVGLANHMTSLGNTVDMVSSIDSVTTTAPESELTNLESVDHQNSHYSYLSTAPNYPGLNLVSQIQGQQHFSIESMESGTVDMSRLSSVLSSYSDSANYKLEADARHSAFLASTLAWKYGGSMLVQSGSPQETRSLVQGAHSINGQTNSQQTMPAHRYASQTSAPPTGPFATNLFNYSYVPSGSFAHTRSPYEQSYTGNMYHQAPTGNTYPQAGAIAAAKYALWPQQYKSGLGGGGTVMLDASSATTVGSSISGYDDAGAPHCKDNTLHMPGQQVQGSAAWLQKELARDLASLQRNSFYNNNPGPSQCMAYSNTHSPLQSQQVLYQSQFLGSGSFPQTQRCQQLTTRSNYL